MIHVEPFQALHLPQVQTLINAHLSALVPGWALPESYIASKLQRDPGEYVVDPYGHSHDLRWPWCQLRLFYPNLADPMSILDSAERLSCVSRRDV